MCLLSAPVMRQTLVVQPGRTGGLALLAQPRCSRAVAAQLQLLYGEQLPLPALLPPAGCQGYVNPEAGL